MIYYQNVFFSREDTSYILEQCDEWVESTIYKHNGEEGEAVVDPTSRLSHHCTKSYKRGSLVHTRIEELLQSMNTTLKSDEIELMVVRYDEGGLIARHTDTNINHPDRRFAICIQLSEDYEGGDFLVWTGDDPEYFRKDIGNVIVLDNNAEHEVTRVTNGQRYSGVVFLDNADIDENKSAI